MPNDLFERLEDKRGMISRSRFYRELIKKGLDNTEVIEND